MGRSILASLLSSVALASPPPTSQYAATARWMVENLDWGYLTTTSSRSKATTAGDPFGNPYAFANVGGVPYFYAADMDASIVDINAGNSRVSFALSEAEFTTGNNTVAACDVTTMYGDPENPPCARLVLSGEFVQLAKGTDEQKIAKAALFAKHPSFPREPHNFFVGKIDVDSVWILDGYGGIPSVSPAEYLAASAAPTLRVQQQEGKQVRASRNRPNAIFKVSTARWMVETLTWGALSTTSSRSEGSMVGDAFANPSSFADAGDGNLYFFASHMDASIIDIQANPRVSFSLSEAALTGTDNSVSSCVVGSGLFGDPENPPCARLVFTGTWVELDTSTSEGATAQAALFARHPSFALYPKSHDFFVAKLDIEGIWFIDQYGGATIMPPKKYLGWSAEADVMVV